MTRRVEIAIGAFFLAIGVAGPPLEPLRMLGAALLCACVTASGRFVAAAALVAVVAAGWLQHQQFRIALLVAAGLLGASARFAAKNATAATALAAACAVLGTAFLFLG